MHLIPLRDDKTKEYDKQVLIVRTFWVLLHIATCLMIILGKIASIDGGKMKVGITFSTFDLLYAGLYCYVT